MTKPGDRLEPESLWDPAAPADPELGRLEEALAPVRFDVARRPLALERRGPRPGRWIGPVALAAAVALLVVLGAAAFRWGWPEGRGWTMTVTDEEGAREEQLVVGEVRRFGPDERGRIQVARIGSMEVAAGTTLSLRATASNRHRLVLTAGAVRTRVWAPPGAVVIKTPAGDVVDLGCVFRLRVDPGGAARLSVDSGWVQLENLLGESLVPAGASSVMERDAAPFVPVFDDAHPVFLEEVRALEGRPSGEVPLADLEALTRRARARDAMTLLALAGRVPPSLRRPLLDRTAALVPPPPGVSVDDVVAGDREQRWRWHDTLDLPPPKSWWRNWRDAL